MPIIRQGCLIPGMILIVLVFLHGCIPLHQGVSRNLFPGIDSGRSAAVTYIPEAESGNITELGNQWRDRIESILAARGIRVKARKDLYTLMEDLESHSARHDEDSVWKKTKADILVCGNYTIIPPKTKISPYRIRVMAKAYNVDSATLVGSEEFIESLDGSWLSLANSVKGNVHQENFKTITSPGTIITKPRLSAALNKTTACFTPGEEAGLTIDSEKGVFLYIFNLTADGSVSLLYPNRWMGNEPTPSSRFVFPGRSNKLFELILYPLTQNETCTESFKIVASRSKLDFSFLPVPVNRMFIGAAGGDINKMADTLKRSTGFSETVLPYSIDERCGG